MPERRERIRETTKLLEASDGRERHRVHRANVQRRPIGTSQAEDADAAEDNHVEGPLGVRISGERRSKVRPEVPWGVNLPRHSRPRSKSCNWAKSSAVPLLS